MSFAHFKQWDLIRCQISLEKNSQSQRRPPIIYTYHSNHSGILDLSLCYVQYHKMQYIKPVLVLHVIGCIGVETGVSETPTALFAKFLLYRSSKYLLIYVWLFTSSAFCLLWNINGWLIKCKQERFSTLL